MPPFPQKPKPWEPKPAEKAQQEYINNARKWANSVLRANERGVLPEFVGEAYSKKIPLSFVGDSRYDLRKNGLWGKPPDKDEAAVVEGSRNIRFDELLKRAGTTFTDAFVKRLEPVVPNPMNDPKTILRYAISMHLASDTEDRLRSKLQDGYKGQSGMLPGPYVDSIVKAVMNSREYNDYESFLNDRYSGTTEDDKKIRYTPSDFNPFVYAEPIIKEFLKPYGIDDVSKMMGPADIPKEEMDAYFQEKGIKPGALTQESERANYYKGRRKYLMESEFPRWRQMMGRQ